MKSNENTKLMNECPDKKFISAFLDGELDKDSQEARHISACPECGKILADYKLLSELLKAKFNAPDRIAERIKTGVDRKLHPQPSPTLSVPQFIFRMAAAFVVFAGLGAYALTLFYSSFMTTPIPFRNAYINTPGAVQMDDFSKVSYTGIPKALEFYGPGRKLDQAAENTVSQLWSVNSKEAVYKLISDFKINGKPVNAMLKSSGPGADRLSVEMLIAPSDVNLFSRTCIKDGFKLISSTPPKKSENTNNNENHQLILKADFVLSNN